MKKKIGSDTVSWLIAVGVTVIVFAIMIAAGLPCPIKYLTGISCAGCGMTRAIIAAFDGDFFAAFHYLPLCLFVPAVICLLIAAYFAKKKRLFNVTLALGLGIMLAVWVVRLMDPECAVVTVDISRSLWGSFVNGGSLNLMNFW